MTLLGIIRLSISMSIVTYNLHIFSATCVTYFGEYPKQASVGTYYFVNKRICMLNSDVTLSFVLTPSYYPPHESYCLSLCFHSNLRLMRFMQFIQDRVDAIRPL